MTDDEGNDPIVPFNELESFDSIFHALQWKQIRTHIPICFKKKHSEIDTFLQILFIL